MKKQTKTQEAAKKYIQRHDNTCTIAKLKWEPSELRDSRCFKAGSKWLERALRRAKKKHPLWSLEALLEDVMK